MSGPYDLTQLGQDCTDGTPMPAESRIKAQAGRQALTKRVAALEAYIKKCQPCKHCHAYLQICSEGTPICAAVTWCNAYREWKAVLNP